MKGSYKSKEQETALKILKCFARRKKVIKLFDDYHSIVSDAKCKPVHGERLQIITPKQILQRFPIALAHIKLTKQNTSNHTFFVLNKRNN